jgi:C4-dicarboxylate-specific signal transduction histidine kinase
MLEDKVSAKMQLAEGLPRVMGDRLQFQQVMLYLIMDAIEPPITTEEDELENVLVAVSDSGARLPNANLEPSFDALDTTKSSAPGLGFRSVARFWRRMAAGYWWAR